jgi:hypothetical protein
MKNKVYKIKSNVLKQMWEPDQKGSARLSMSKERYGTFAFGMRL